MRTLNQIIKNTFLTEKFIDNAGAGINISKEDIKAEIEKTFIIADNVVVNDDLTVDADEIKIESGFSDIEPDYEIKFKFNKVKYFTVRGLKIKDLTNFPKQCIRLVIERCPNITSLKGIPEILNEVYNGRWYKRNPGIELISCSKLKNLDGIKDKFPMMLRIEKCGIQDFTGIPKKLNKLYIGQCNKLTSLKGLEKIDISHCFTIDGCSKITNLKYAPNELEKIHLWNYQGESLKGLEKCNIKTCIAIERCMKLKKLTGLNPEFSGILYADLKKLKAFEDTHDMIEEQFPNLKWKPLYF